MSINTVKTEDPKSRSFWSRIVQSIYRDRQVLSGSELRFREVVECERDRADRNGHQFSLVLFALGPKRPSSDGERELFHVISNRTRSFDTVGRLNGQLAVLLPYTTADGACVVARDAARVMSARFLQVDWEIHTYPDNWFDDELFGHGPQNQSELVTTASTGRRAGIQWSQAIGTRDPLIRRTPLWKRGIDLAGSILGLILLWPLFVAIALLIKVVSPGPVFFRQPRIGLGGRLFTILKFRTMHVDVDVNRHRRYVEDLANSDGPLAKPDHGHQLIPFGSFLRNLGLDELPQLFNVLRGEMSLIGPRPDVVQYHEYETWNLRRFEVAPGITGLWQVSGKNRTTFKQMIRLDIAYSRRRSLFLDVRILLKTIPSLLCQLCVRKDSC